MLSPKNPVESCLIRIAEKVSEFSKSDYLLYPLLLDDGTWRAVNTDGAAFRDLWLIQYRDDFSKLSKKFSPHVVDSFLESVNKDDEFFVPNMVVWNEERSAAVYVVTDEDRDHHSEIFSAVNHTSSFCPALIYTAEMVKSIEACAADIAYTMANRKEDAKLLRGEDFFVIGA